MQTARDWQKAAVESLTHMCRTALWRAYRYTWQRQTTPRHKDPKFFGVRPNLQRYLHPVGYHVKFGRCQCQDRKLATWVNTKWTAVLETQWILPCLYDSLLTMKILSKNHSTAIRVFLFADMQTNCKHFNVIASVWGVITTIN